MSGERRPEQLNFDTLAARDAAGAQDRATVRSGAQECAAVPSGGPDSVAPRMHDSRQTWTRLPTGDQHLTSIEICAGAGGQAIGLDRAGFEHLALVELDAWACQTLRLNRPDWNVLHADLREFSAERFAPVDLLAGGVPCPPFSMAGKQLGADDERDMFPQALRLVEECRPRAVMLENVRGLLDPKFADYRAQLEDRLRDLGYEPHWKLLHASDYGVPQLRPRTLLVAMEAEADEFFAWPEEHPEAAPTVGEALAELMAEAGWVGARAWAAAASKVGPTLVGGSKKHGGPDLGPTRARAAWATLGVDGRGLANDPPAPDFDGMPTLTARMTAVIQGFPPDWQFAGRKTAAYRQIGNAFPPPVAHAVAASIASALRAARAAAATREAIAA
jgi:DNA (cytosine-5)-methyltransferase 1